jgi:hypothetical protein
MRTLGLVQHAAGEPGRDLWPRLRERLADDDRVELRLPAFTWTVGLAVAAAAATVCAVPEPIRFLSAVGVL